MRPARARPSGVDVVIVGAGPAGIATAVGCRAAGLSYALLEQDTVGGTVAHYPRQKLVMTETVDLPFYGKFGRKLIRRRTGRIVLAGDREGRRSGPREDRRSPDIDGDKDNFVVSDRSRISRARRVVLAIGRRGTPRKLGVPGEELEKVAYRLVDPHQYAGKRVLVVGGGDSALEAAIQLAEESDATRRRSRYRKPEFGRCRPLNKQRLDAHAARAAASARSCRPRCVGGRARRGVRCKNGDHARIPNDFVIACLGGELPTEFLKIDRRLDPQAPRRQGDGEPGAGAQESAQAQRARGRDAVCSARARWSSRASPAVGRKYYPPAARLRYKAAEHACAEAVGAVGPRRRRARDAVHAARTSSTRCASGCGCSRARGSIAPWLRLPRLRRDHEPAGDPVSHRVPVGQPARDRARTSRSLVVVATGLVGRFVYGWVASIRMDDRGDSDWQRRLAKHRRPDSARVAAARASERSRRCSTSWRWSRTGRALPRRLLGLFLHMPVRGAGACGAGCAAAGGCSSTGAYRSFCAAACRSSGGCAPSSSFTVTSSG